MRNPRVPVSQWPSELDVGSLCRRLFRDVVEPGRRRDHPARQMADCLRLYIDDEE